MTVLVLQSKPGISSARRLLKQRHISQVSRGAEFKRWLTRHGLFSGIIVGDTIKSWDVHQTVDFVEQTLPRTAPILDIGACQSEIICVLRRLGYSDLTGVDLDPTVKQMPHADSVRYEIADFMQTPFSAGSFRAITAISVIEHGFQRERLLQEISRLLSDGGYFLASFDYWPAKQDTSAIRIFDMSWTIFCRTEVQELIEAAEQNSLYPIGDVALDAGEPVVDMFGRQYTFAWMALQKSAR